MFPINSFDASAQRGRTLKSAIRGIAFAGLRKTGPQIETCNDQHDFSIAGTSSVRYLSMTISAAGEHRVPAGSPDIVAPTGL